MIIKIPKLRTGRPRFLFYHPKVVNSVMGTLEKVKWKITLDESLAVSFFHLINTRELTKNAVKTRK